MVKQNIYVIIKYFSFSDYFTSYNKMRTSKDRYLLKGMSMAMLSPPQTWCHRGGVHGEEGGGEGV